MPDPQTETPVTTLAVDIFGNVTVRTYTDGTVQRNAWATTELAQEYAQSVADQEGLQ
jgi:hypothetical protein